MNISEIENLLRKAFPDSNISVQDMTGGGDHFEVFIESYQFAGKKLLEQHRLVYAAIGSAMDGPVHALKIHTQERKA